jgi:transposase
MYSSREKPNKHPDKEAQMRLYCGIDLHGNNNVISIIDEEGSVMFEKRLPNDLEKIRQALKPHREKIVGIVVESTYNWYWLVDGLMEDGYLVHLANPAAIQQYDGLKFSDDKSDARWLAHMLKLDILPEGYIYPKAERPIRDLLRKRSQLVRYRVSNLLSVSNLIARNLGHSVAGNRLQQLKEEDISELMKDDNLALAANANLAVLQCVNEQIKAIEKVVKGKVKLRPEFRMLKTVPGIGDVLALSIALETGDIGRFPTVGDFSSYCRTVRSERISNGKKKGKGNAKNGNKYLAWAFIEAANFAVRFNPSARKFYQRKSAKRKAVVARKALANKLARACYYIMRDGVPFNNERLFAT